MKSKTCATLILTIFLNSIFVFGVSDAKANESLQDVFGSEVEICMADGGHIISIEEFTILLSEIGDEFSDKNKVSELCLFSSKEYFIEISNLEAKKISYFSSDNFVFQESFYITKTSLDPPSIFRFI